MHLIRHYLLWTALIIVAGCSSAPTPVGATDDHPPQAKFAVQPTYPSELRQKGLRGEATVEFIITKSGKIAEAHVTHASHPLFADAALAAILQSKYLPGTKQGAPVNALVHQTFQFAPW